MDPSEGEKTTDREILEPSEGERTTMDREAMDWIAEGKGFLQDYYRTFEVNRADVANLYSEDSVMTFDGEKIQGKEAILSKLTSLELSRIQILNIDCLPVGGTDLRSGFSGMVCGYIWLDGKQDARSFSQMFVLLPTPEGSFDISHSILCTGLKYSGTALASSEGERTKIMADVCGAEGFLQAYYRTFEVNGADVANLYRENLVMTIEGRKFLGKEAIRAKLTSLKLLRFQILNINCLPVPPTDQINSVVCGDIWSQGKPGLYHFSQMFVLLPTPEGSFDILQSILHIGLKSSGTALASSEGERTKIMGDVGGVKEFLQDYCRTFEVNQADVANLYREDSRMNFDGENIQGKEAIRAKLTSLKLLRIQVLNIDCLPVGGTDLCSGFSGMVCSYIWLDGKQDARLFSQTFSLHPTPEGSFVISNSIFIHIGMESYGAGAGTGTGTGTALGSSARLSPFP